MQENNYFVYKHTFPNNKVYIGITQQQPEKRWKNGLGYDSHQEIMKRAIKKYGWNNIKHDILFQNLSKDEACKKYSTQFDGICPDSFLVSDLSSFLTILNTTKAQSGITLGSRCKYPP